MTVTGDVDAGLRGRFWLPGAPHGEAVPGRLVLKPGADPLLELDGALVPLMRETGRRPLPGGGQARVSSPVSWQELAGQSLTVHGTLDETGELVTLPSAFTAGWTTRGAGSYSHRLQAFYALAGGHVDGADALFTRVRTRIRHLDAWADLPGFTLTPGQPGTFTLSFDKPDVAAVTLASGARLALEQVAGWDGPDACGGTLERQVWMDVTGMPPATYRDIERTVVKPLANLLTLCVSADCPVVAVMVSAGPDHPWLTVHHAALQPPAQTVIRPHCILLPLAGTGLEGAAAWLDSAVRLGPLPSVIARAAASTDDALETQLLELTTAAEGLHRLLLQQRRRMTDEQAAEARGKALDAIRDLLDDVRDAVWGALAHLTDQSYPRRLLDLAGHTGDAVPGVTGDTAKWKKRVAGARIGFAHALEHGFVDPGTADQSAAILLSLRWLLTGLLLLQTGIDAAALGQRLSGHEPYQLFLAQARAWLPEVYGPGEDPQR